MDGQHELLDARAASREVDEQFHCFRKDRATGANGYKNQEKIDVTHFVKKTDKDFSKNSVFGTFEPLWLFAKQRRLPFSQETDNDEALIEYIEEKYPAYRVAKNKRGVVGVEILDLPLGAERFERGVEEATELSKIEKYGDKYAARERAEDLLAKKRARCGCAGYNRRSCCGKVSQQQWCWF